VSTVGIVVVAVVAVLLLLAVGGAIANARRRRAGDPGFRARLERADHDLAEAYATDRGWERGRLEQVARRAWASEGGGTGEDAELRLLEVTDLPGTDEDMAVFHVRSGDRSARVTLRRTGQDWRPEHVTPD
jgi:hypothetical protein